MRDESWAVAGFGQGSLYDAARPCYPDEAISHLVHTFTLGAHSRVLDLGAGTGIFTRQLQKYVGEIVAVDPSPSMRETFELQTPDVAVLDGNADAIPLADATCDAVFAAQAFHWFNPGTALPEIRRVLAPGGGLGLVWNRRDTEVDWIRELDHAMLWDQHQPYESRRDYGAVVASGPFENVALTTFRHCEELTHEQVLQRVMTTSYITLMDPAQRDGLLNDVTKVIESIREPVGMAYATDVITAHAI